MKPTSLLVAFFFFLLFTFTTTTTSTTLAEKVIDSDGDIMRNGGRYHLSPAAPYGGGAIISAAIRHGDTDFCSLAVVRALYTNGWATVISSPFRTGFIATTFPLNISFAYLAPNICTDSPDWVITRSGSLGETVMLGTDEEFGEAYVRGWFYIKTYDSDKHYYKLVFREEGKEYRNIGYAIDSKKRQRLVLTDDKPLVFKFDKVNDESFASDLSMVV